MASLTPPLSWQCHHHQKLPILHKITSISNNNNHFRSNPKAKVSLSLSTQTHLKERPPRTNNSTHHPVSYLEQVHNLCESGNLNEALNFLQADFDNAISSSEQRKEAIGVLLQVCGHHKDIELGRKLHHIVSASAQFGNDLVLITRIITMYSMCGSPADSRSVFDGLPRKNLFQWNALLSCYSRNELFDDAIALFTELISVTELTPDNFTLPCAIKACTRLLDVELGEVIHGLAVKMGSVSDVFVGNALIAMYGKCGFVEKAFKVFECMPERNLVSWNSMMNGYSENGLCQESYHLLFKGLLNGEEGLIPDVATMVTIIPVSAAESDVNMGMQLHGLALKLGLTRELMVNNSLVDMYSKCGCLPEAQFLFDMIDNKNVVSWNSMIGGYSKEGDACGTFDLLLKMQMEEKVKVNEVTLLNVLPACLEESQLLSLKELHGYSFRHGFQDDELVVNAFIAAYAKCGSLSYAENVFHGMKTKSVSSWNALIGGYVQNGFPGKAFGLCLLMRDSGLDHDCDCFTIASLLLACAHLKFLCYGKEIHGYTLRNGLEMDEFICISLLSLYIHCEKILPAKLFFDRMKDKSLVCWNSMITGFSQNGLPIEALDTFRQMLSSGSQPYEIAITGVLGACSQLSGLRIGKEVHSYALKAHLMEDTFVSCSLIDMYAKSGCMEQSRSIFDRVKEKDEASWNVIITGYGIHGHGHKAIELFELMQSSGCRPDSFTFIGVLTACSHAGLVTEGLKYFSQMQSLYEIEPKLEHYACVMDMLGRAGRLNEALELVNELPEKPDARIWSSLLSSCKSYGDLDIGEKVSTKLLELGPDKAENYVLLSNFYAGLGKWDDVRRVRQRMKEIGLQKDAGCCWIEIEGKVYRFLVGDGSLPE